MKIIRILAISLILVAFFLSSCSNNIVPTTTLTSTNATSQYTSLPITTKTTFEPKFVKVTAVTDKTAYLPRENVEITFSVTNITQGELLLSNFPYLSLRHYGGELVKTFYPESPEVKLATGETKTITIQWNQLDDWGMPINPAVYWIYLKSISIAQGSEGFPELTTITINYPQGAMQKIITMDQSQTAEGVTINLYKVEMTEMVMKVYMMKTPLPPLTNPNEPPNWSKRGEAYFQVSYRFDGGRTIETDHVGWNVLDDGVQYVCEDMYLPPSDAQTLYFSIVKMSIPDIGDYGPFDFVIPLQ